MGLSQPKKKVQKKYEKEDIRTRAGKTSESINRTLRHDIESDHRPADT